MNDLATRRRRVGRAIPRHVLLVISASALVLHGHASSDGGVLLQELSAGVPGPELRTPDGAPVVGGPFSLQVRKAPPNATGAVVLSAHETPTVAMPSGATVYPGTPQFLESFVTNGLGISPALFESPAVTEDLVGVQLVAQARVADLSAPGGVQWSNAVRFRVGVVDHPRFPERHYADLYHACFADLDRDGVLDVAGVDPLGASNVLRTRPGLGDGTFGDARSFPVGSPPQDLVIADLDGDAILDAAVLHGIDTVASLLGDGHRFRLVATRPVGRFPTDLIAADFDGDGALDLAVSLVFPYEVSIAAGLGDGSFGHVDRVPTLATAFRVDAADLDQDGNVDLVLPRGDVVVHLGNGDGTFAPPFGVGVSASAVAIADLDGDSVLDLAAGSGSDVRTYAGNGDGTFGPPQVVPVLPGLSDLAAVDLDGNAVLDLVFTRSRGFNQDGISVLLGQGGGAFAPPLDFAAGNTPGPIATGDLDGDGAPDVGFGNIDPAAETDLAVLMGRGDGTLETILPLPSVPSTNAGTPAPGPSARGSSDARLDSDRVSVDLDRDGSADEATIVPGTNEVVVRLRQQGGALGAPRFWSLPSAPLSLAAVDLDGDRILDLVAGHRRSISVLRGLGDGTFADPRPRPIGSGASSLGTGDLTGDGDADLAALGYYQDEVTILESDGHGGFVRETVFGCGFAPASVTVKDLDGDGILDLLVDGWSLLPWALINGIGEE